MYTRPELFPLEELRAGHFVRSELDANNDRWMPWMKGYQWAKGLTEGRCEWYYITDVEWVTSPEGEVRRMIIHTSDKTEMHVTAEDIKAGTSETISSLFYYGMQPVPEEKTNA